MKNWFRTWWFVVVLTLAIPTAAWLHTNTWNSAYEASPADADPVSEGASKIRALKGDIRERLAKDHYFDIAGTDADHGEHKFATLREQSSKPTVTTNKGAIYAKDVSGVTELYYENDAGTEAQITSGGAIKGSGISADAGITGSMIANNTIALGTKTTGNYVGTVAAGSGITVSGSDGEGVTKTVAVTTGGITATHIANNAVTLNDIYPGSVQILSRPATYSPSTGAYTAMYTASMADSWVNVAEARVAVPSGASEIYCEALIARGSTGDVQCRINVDSTNSTDYVSASSASYAWKSCGTVDVSASAAGYYPLTFQLYTTDTPGYVAGLACWYN